MSTPLGERATEDALRRGNALLKFISRNDAGQTRSHQAGFYLPKSIWAMYTPHAPRRGTISKHPVKILWPDGRTTESVVTYYGQRTRDEFRLTRFGKDFPYLTRDNVGDLLVLIPRNLSEFTAYVLDFEEDIEGIQAALGIQLTETWAIYEAGKERLLETPKECIERQFREIASAIQAFPPTKQLSEATRKAIDNCIKELANWTPDDKLLEWMDKEYILYRMVERQLCQSQIVRPFGSVDDFLNTAASIMNRRKARAGRSLENHVEFLLRDAGIPFDMRAKIDGKKEPDVLIPGKSAYDSASYPAEKLYILGLKTTCKDRWRQVLSEGDRVKRKHILTLQPGISKNQLHEMQASGVTLIVPERLHKEYPKESRGNILTVGKFIRQVRTLIA